MLPESSIALIGVSCRFPGAENVEQYWDNLCAGTDSISRFGRSDLLASGLDPALLDEPGFVPARGVVPRADLFDRALFGFSAAEAATMDPQQRAFLECSLQALDDAGVDPDRSGRWTGMFAGGDLTPSSPAGPADAATLTRRVIGREKDFLATRVAYKLDLRGPAITVQTACSTGLVAVHQACRALLGHECDVALAGAAALRTPQVGGHVYQEGSILSADGRCRAFDADATGTVNSGGVGVVVLKRLDDALADDDRIIAVIRGSAVNNDGRDKVGYTAPSVTGQRDVIGLALAQAGVSSDRIGYVEAHGTGTPVGDPVEIAALTAAFAHASEGLRTRPCLLGTVKANIGHAGAAAGMAGLIKTALMLAHRTLVPTPHFARPNPALNLDASPFRVGTEHRPWEHDGPRLAGVSSFGIGGTNVHLVLEEPPDAEPSVAGEPRPLCLSAASPEALRTARDELAERLSAPGAPSPADAARTLAARHRHPHRLSVVAATAAEAAARLRDRDLLTRAADRPQVAFLFPGQGTLTAGHGRVARAMLPVFREVFEECRAHLRARHGLDLAPMLDPGTDPDWFLDTRHQQLGLFAHGYGLARQLAAWDITPTALLGHSVGEYVAAAVAGVWEWRDALDLVHARSTAMHEAGPGRMLALREPLAQVSALLDGSLAVATVGSGHVVLSGPAERIETIAADRRAAGAACRLLPTAHAFHSPLMAGAAEILRDAVAGAPARAPQVRCVSGLTGDWADPDRLADPGHWARQLTGTVRLDLGMRTLADAGVPVVVELGPGDSLTREAVRQESHAVVLPMLGRTPGHEQRALLDGLARLWEHGAAVDWDSLPSIRSGRICSLPPHPLAATVVGPLPASAHPSSARPSAPTPGAGPDAGRAGDAAGHSGRFTAAAAAVTWADGAPSLSRRTELGRALDLHCAGLLGRRIATMAGLTDGLRIDDRQLRRRIDPDDRRPALTRFCLGVLEQEEWLRRDGDGWHAAATLTASIAAALDTGSDLDEVAGLRRILRHVTEAYPDVFAGRRTPVSVLYPDADPGFLDDCLGGNDVPLDDSAAALAALRDLVRTATARRGGDPARPLRVLEVGAGAGRLTWPLLTGWTDRTDVEYHVTDVSPLIVRRARAHAADLGLTDLRFSTYDINRDPASQRLLRGHYDLVLGYNVVHVAGSVPTALTRLASLLRPGGTLGMVEVTDVARWAHVVWGMAPGWWDFDDDLRTDSIHLDAPTWTRAVGAAGFTDVTTVDAGTPTDHVVILGTSPGPEHLRLDDVPAAPAAPETGPEAAPAALSVVTGDPLRDDLAALWREVLGTPGAADRDDFHDLGGDSLMFVQLCGMVNRSVGHPVPVASYPPELTFGALVDAVRNTLPVTDRRAPDRPARHPGTRPGALPDQLSLLRDGGARRPLFLVAPATGTSLCYRLLVDNLEADRPVYGLDAPGLADHRRPLTRLEDLAGHHVTVLRLVQPSGPYLLGGWSYGAMVAHEMTRLLEAMGESVELLVAIDGFLPATRGLPVGALPHWLLPSLRLQWNARFPRRHATNGGDTGPARIADLAGPRRTPGAPDYVRLHNTGITAMLRHRPRPIGAPMLLLKAGADTDRCAALARTLAPLHGSGVTVRPLPGDHHSILGRRDAPVLAAEIGRALAAAEPATAAPVPA